MEKENSLDELPHSFGRGRDYCYDIGVAAYSRHCGRPGNHHRGFYRGFCWANRHGNPGKSTEATAASTPDAQDPNPDSKSDPNKDLQDLSNDLSNNKDKDKDGSSITYDDKGAIESVGSVTTDTLKFIGAIIKVLAGVAGLMVLLGKAFPAVKDMIHNIARGGHL